MSEKRDKQRNRLTLCFRERIIVIFLRCRVCICFAIIHLIPHKIPLKRQFAARRSNGEQKKTASSFNHIKAKHLDNIKKNNKISLNINENPVFFIIIFVAEPSIVCGR